MGFILTIMGALLLFVCLAGIAFGLFMAADAKTRESGAFFAIWWVSGTAAASGVLMRDVVTFAVGLLCFLVAGAAFTFGDTGYRAAQVRRRGGPPDSSERTTKENKADRNYGKAAS